MYRFISKAKLPTAHGEFDIHVFENDEGQEHIMLSVGLPSQTDALPIVRVHSECLTGDAFSSLKCDCGPQLNAAMKAIQAHGTGAILYLRQEGRGIGLTNKIRAYALQDQGHDTLEANLLLGLPADARTYEMCKDMLASVGVTQVALMTNNPNKINDLTKHGIDVVKRIPLVVGVNPHNQDYLDVKEEKMGHMIHSE
ncbi:GTP cyclohydrolase-2 [Moraxella caviae]|uniref:GTP cyclohydrolase-2 n=1 Tax=Moraxella caviae TaxID=34060 RepID=A0A378R407_9GAMM|nr:GTP cyclohydrolase II [Moraxella caviae]STZ09934.1 GTP cyclohydrolase-2 [Moraxella caviae]VEW13088.1 GTP cyclohydrolase-2 [Moraxella caviae]